MINIAINHTVGNIGRHNGCMYRHSGCIKYRHDGCGHRHNGCCNYRHSGYAEAHFGNPNVIADATTPLQRMQRYRHKRCIVSRKKMKYAFKHKVPRRRSKSTNPLLIFSNYRSASTVLDQETDHAPTAFRQRGSQRTGIQEISVIQCKNIANFTFECKGIQNFRFHYIAKLHANICSSWRREPNQGSSPSIFSVAAHAQSRGVKGPPLPTQFGRAKLYRG